MDNFLTNVPFTTSGALVDIVDKKILVSLRDGKKLIGVLRSYDQFANLVLQDTIERIHVDISAENGKQTSSADSQIDSKPICKYADIWRGIYLVRGENVVLLGEIDLDKEDEVIKDFQQEPIERINQIQKLEDQLRSDLVKRNEIILFDRLGFSKEGEEDDRY